MKKALPFSKKKKKKLSQFLFPLTLKEYVYFS